MKVLIFVKNFAAPTLTFIYNEVTGLQKYAQVKIITLKRSNADKFPFNDVEILHGTKARLVSRILHPLQTRDFAFSYKDSGIERQIDKIISEFKPDIIHTHFGYESWWFLANLKPQKIPVFISFHGFDASHKLNSQRYITTFKYFNKLHQLNKIFVSEYMAKTVEERTGKLKDKYILYYGTDIGFFKRENYDAPKKPFRFIQISSFTEKKGHEYTIRAFAGLLERCKDYDPRLILAGEGQKLQAMQELCRTLCISDKVQFVGLVDKHQAKSLMETANVFVHHSITSDIGDKEGIPNALMEAMAMELPVISTIHSGIPELVTDMVNGFLVKEKDVQAYANAMHQSLSAHYQKINREKIAEKFERKKHVELLVGYYRKSLGSE